VLEQDSGELRVVAVTVVVPVHDDFEQMKKLVRSLDLQTMPTDEFEVVLHGVDGEAGVDQFDALAAHRPNVKVVRTTDAAVDLLAAAEGDFVLVVDRDEALFPGALARLHGFAEQHGVDAVAGRVVTAGNSAPVWLWTDTAVVRDPDIIATLTDRTDAVSAQLLVRRDAARLTEGRLLQSASTRIGVLGSHAITLRDGQSVDSGAEARSVVPPVAVESATWRDGSLHLMLRTAGSGSASGERRAVLQLTHAGTQETFLVPAEISTAELSKNPLSEGSPGGPQLQVEAAVAPTRTPANGQQLAVGSWHVSLVLAIGRETMPPTPIPWLPCPPALIGSTAVVPAPTATASGSQWLTLDVGPMHRQLLSNVDPAAGTVTESVVGSELVLNVPQLHVYGTDGLDGFIALDKIRLPARIRSKNGHAQLVAFVSGVAGKPPAIAAQFGPGPLRATGLSLQISGVGTMSVIKTPPAPQVPAKPPSAPKPVAKNETSKVDSAQPKPRKKAERPRTGVIADVRRAVPASLEPAVKRLASIPAARRLYRWVTR
jgi:hypothetical protein